MPVVRCVVDPPVVVTDLEVLSSFNKNSPEFTKFVVDTIKEADTDAIKNVERCEPQPPSEDFAYYAKTIPGTFIYAGAAPENGEIHPHHHPKFNISESSMRVSAEAVGLTVLNYLK